MKSRTSLVQLTIFQKSISIHSLTTTLLYLIVANLYLANNFIQAELTTFLNGVYFFQWNTFLKILLQGFWRINFQQIGVLNIKSRTSIYQTIQRCSTCNM